MLLFDLDGVLTDTASLHRKAWKAMLDGFLRRRSQRTGEEFAPFDVDADYLRYVDSETHEDGVRSFLASRGIELPEGDEPATTPPPQLPADSATRRMPCSYKPYTKAASRSSTDRAATCRPSTAGCWRWRWCRHGHAREVLEVTGLDQYVRARRGRSHAARVPIAGKPAPDSFLEGARLLGVEASEAAVFEDALAGVAASRAVRCRGEGVDRVPARPEALRAHGADVVVRDLADLLAPR